METTQEDM